MSRRPVVAGLVRSLIMVSTVISSSALLSAGTASADSAAAPASSSVGATTQLVLGMPLGTLTWALLGLVILVSGLVAASRSGRRTVVTANGIGISSVPGAAEAVLRDVKSGSVDAMGDFGRSVTAV